MRLGGRRRQAGFVRHPGPQAWDLWFFLESPESFSALARGRLSF